jgi:hypothetical protein
LSNINAPSGDEVTDAHQYLTVIRSEWLRRIELMQLLADHRVAGPRVNRLKACLNQDWVEHR